MKDEYQKKQLNKTVEKLKDGSKSVCDDLKNGDTKNTEESSRVIYEMGNVELFELGQISMNVQCHSLQEWETTQNGCKVRCAQRCELSSLRSDLSSRRLCAEKYVSVMSTVPGCDVTTVQRHYTGSTSILTQTTCQIDYKFCGCGKERTTERLRKH